MEVTHAANVRVLHPQLLKHILNGAAPTVDR